jgi:leader peptidase (prepilin peptidase)/N-methyltransferase
MWGMFATLLVSTTAGALVGIALLRSGDGLKTRLPFGVFLSIGALIALFFGQAMISYYLTFF